MPASRLLMGLVGVGLVVGGSVIALALVSMAVLPDESAEDPADEVRTENAIRQDSLLPTGYVNEPGLPYDTVAYDSHLLITGGKPTGGFLAGRVVQDTYVTGGLFTILVNSWQHQIKGHRPPQLDSRLQDELSLLPSEQGVSLVLTGGLLTDADRQRILREKATPGGGAPADNPDTPPPTPPPRAPDDNEDDNTPDSGDVNVPGPNVVPRGDRSGERRETPTPLPEELPETVDFFAADLSVFKQRSDKSILDLVPVYSPIRGTVVEVNNQWDENPDKPTYGSFVRIRNAQYACMLEETLWEIEASVQRELSPLPDEEPRYYYQEDEVLDCPDHPNSELSAACQADRLARCQTCGEGNNHCVVDWFCYQPECAREDENGVCLEAEIGEVVNSCLLACDDKVPDLGEGVVCEHLYTLFRPPIRQSGDYSISGLSEEHFPLNEATSRMRYQKIPNYEVVISNLTTGSIGNPDEANPDELITNCHTLGGSVTPDDQCGTMGSSGTGGNDPFAHYEVWQYPAPGKLEPVNQPARAINQLPNEQMCSTRPNVRSQSAHLEDFIGCTDPGPTPTIPAPCCPPVEPIAVAADSENQCQDEQGNTHWEVRGANKQDGGYLMQVVNPGTDNLRGEFEVSLSCEETRWYCVFKGELRPGEAWSWEDGELPTVCFAEDEAGPAPSCNGVAPDFNIRSRLSNHDCQLPEFTPTQSVSEGALADYRASVERHQQACRYEPSPQTPSLGNQRQIGDKIEGGAPIPDAAQQCASGGTILESQLEVRQLDAEEPVDVLDYMLPSASREHRVTLGGGTAGSNAHERVLRTRPTQVDDKAGFVIEQLDASGQQVEQAEHYYYDDDYIYLSKISPAQQPGQPPQTLLCENDSPLSLLGFAGEQALASCEGAGDLDLEAGIPILPRTMSVGESHTAPHTMLSQDESGNCCQSSLLGPRIPQETMLLARSTLRYARGGGEYGDVLSLMIVAGDRRGQVMFFDKGAGLVAYEQTDASMSGVCSYGYPL